MKEQEKEVYVVTRGSYEDYEIAAVFGDRSVAEAFNDKLYDSNNVVPYRVRTSMPKQRKLFGVILDGSGTVTEKRCEVRWDFDPPFEESAGVYLEGGAYRDGGAWGNSRCSYKAAIQMARAELNKARGKGAR